MTKGNNSNFMQSAISKFDGNYDHGNVDGEFSMLQRILGLVENEILVVADGIDFTEAQRKLIEE